MKLKEELLVTPEYLMQKAAEWETVMKEAESRFYAMEEVMASTISCFMGRTGNKFRKEMTKKREQGEWYLKSLKQFPDKLRIIAFTYEETERRNQLVF